MISTNGNVTIYHPLIMINVDNSQINGAYKKLLITKTSREIYTKIELTFYQ